MVFSLTKSIKNTSFLGSRYVFYYFFDNSINSDYCLKNYAIGITTLN